MAYLKARERSDSVLRRSSPLGPLLERVQSQLALYAERQRARELGPCRRCGSPVSSEQDAVREYGSLVHARCRIARAPVAASAAASLVSPTSTARSRPHWVIAELDVRGEIDRHATMCLEQTIAGALAGGAREIVIDLRDLTSIDARALAVFVRAHADCRAGGIDLGLLISGRAGHAAIAHALGCAGLGGQLRVAWEPAPAAAPATPRRRGLQARTARVRASLRYGQSGGLRRSRAP